MVRVPSRNLMSSLAVLYPTPNFWMMKSSRPSRGIPASAEWRAASALRNRWNLPLAPRKATWVMILSVRFYLEDHTVRNTAAFSPPHRDPLAESVCDPRPPPVDVATTVTVLHEAPNQVTVHSSVEDWSGPSWPEKHGLPSHVTLTSTVFRMWSLVI